MRVTLLGHAAVLVERACATCLMDPVCFDSFEEGAVAFCRRRRTYPQRLSLSFGKRERGWPS